EGVADELPDEAVSQNPVVERVIELRRMGVLVGRRVLVRLLVVQQLRDVEPTVQVLGALDVIAADCDVRGAVGPGLCRFALTGNQAAGVWTPPVEAASVSRAQELE